MTRYSYYRPSSEREASSDYSYDFTHMVLASRVTFGRFGRPADEGGGPAPVLLDGVEVGEIERIVDMKSVGVTQKAFNILAYVAVINGPLGFAPEAVSKFDDKEFDSLPALKKALTDFLGRLPEGVSEAYRLYKQRKITPAEWQSKVRALLP